MSTLKIIYAIVFLGVLVLPFFVIHERTNIADVEEAPTIEFQNTETITVQTQNISNHFTDHSLNDTNAAGTVRVLLKTTCRQTYFWGGGKAGSTSLYFTLAGKEDYADDNNKEKRAFVRYGVGGVKKEPCLTSIEWKKWVNMTRDTNLCSSDGDVSHNVMLDGNGYTNSLKYKASHILNGCPRHTSVFEAKQLMELGDGRVTFLMLIRDPVDRFVSQLNDEIRRSKKYFNLEDLVQKAIKIRLRTLSAKLSFQGLALKNLLSVVNDTKKILIIPMESLTVDMQGAVDAIMTHVGGERWNISQNTNAHMNNGLNRKRDHKYMTISENTTETLRDMFRADVQLLESLIGKHFPWSSWARNSEYSDENWLTTIPIA